MPGGVAIIGAGGHAREVMFYVHRAGFRVRAFLDMEAGERLLGVQVLKESEQSFGRLVFGVGDGRIRCEVMERHPASQFVTIADPSAVVGEDVELGAGAMVCPNAVLTTGISIGNAALINMGVLIHHDVAAGDFLTCAPGSHILGGVTLGDHVFMGAGAVAREGVSIASGAIIGAGAVVVEDITEPGTYAGVPARRINV